MNIIIGLIAANSLVFSPSILSPGLYANMMYAGAKDNAAINDGEYYRLLTSTFLHADLLHLLINMYSLYQIGPEVIYRFSAAGFSTIYLLSGLGGGAMSYFMNPNRSVGASGAISGLVGALLALGIVAGRPEIISSIISVIALNAFLGFTNPQIDNWGHLGGLITGFVVGFAWLTLVPNLA